MIIGTIIAIILAYVLFKPKRRTSSEESDDTYFISCDYEEFIPDTYKGICVEVDDGYGDLEEVQRYNSGCFNSDFRRATKNYPSAHVMSSCTHYELDQKPMS